jgi:hypothetical protein
VASQQRPNAEENESFAHTRRYNPLSIQLEKPYSDFVRKEGAWRPGSTGRDGFGSNSRLVY